MAEQPPPPPRSYNAERKNLSPGSKQKWDNEKARLRMQQKRERQQQQPQPRQNQEAAAAQATQPRNRLMEDHSRAQSDSAADSESSTLIEDTTSGSNRSATTSGGSTGGSSHNASAAMVRQRRPMPQRDMLPHFNPFRMAENPMFAAAMAMEMGRSIGTAVAAGGGNVNVNFVMSGDQHINNKAPQPNDDTHRPNNEILDRLDGLTEAVNTHTSALDTNTTTVNSVIPTVSAFNKRRLSPSAKGKSLDDTLKAQDPFQYDPQRDLDGPSTNDTFELRGKAANERNYNYNELVQDGYQLPLSVDFSLDTMRDFDLFQLLDAMGALVEGNQTQQLPPHMLRTVPQKNCVAYLYDADLPEAYPATLHGDEATEWYDRGDKIPIFLGGCDYPHYFDVVTKVVRDGQEMDVTFGVVSQSDEHAPALIEALIGIFCRTDCVTESSFESASSEERRFYKGPFHFAKTIDLELKKQGKTKKLSIQKFRVNRALYNNLEHQTSLKMSFRDCVFADDNSAVPENVQWYTGEEIRDNDIGDTHQSPKSDGKPCARAETPEFSIPASTVETPAAVAKPPASNSAKTADAAGSATCSTPKAANAPKPAVADGSHLKSAATPKEGPAEPKSSSLKNDVPASRKETDSIAIPPAVLDSCWDKYSTKKCGNCGTPADPENPTTKCEACKTPFENAERTTENVNGVSPSVQGLSGEEGSAFPTSNSQNPLLQGSIGESGFTFQIQGGGATSDTHHSLQAPIPAVPTNNGLVPTNRSGIGGNGFHFPVGGGGASSSTFHQSLLAASPPVAATSFSDGRDHSDVGGWRRAAEEQRRRAARNNINNSDDDAPSNMDSDSGGRLPQDDRVPSLVDESVPTEAVDETTVEEVESGGTKETQQGLLSMAGQTPKVDVPTEAVDETTVEEVESGGTKEIQQGLLSMAGQNPKVDGQNEHQEMENEPTVTGEDSIQAQDPLAQATPMLRRSGRPRTQTPFFKPC